jgi:hypothetical protein
MGFNAREFFTEFAAAINGRDHDVLASMIHADFVASIPQSGERSSGFAAFVKQMETYPGGAPDMPVLPDARIIGDDDRWAITPSYTVVPLNASNEFVVLSPTRYPDGTLWHVMSIIEIRDRQVYRMENYFAPEMEAPLWPRIGSRMPG